MDAGTAQILTDLDQTTGASYQFSAWGELFSSTGTASTPLSWNGEWGYYRDTSARTWVRARHHDVLRGRWLSRDPIGFTAGPNVYAYANNHAVEWVDPEGLIAPWLIAGGVGALAGGVIGGIVAWRRGARGRRLWLSVGRGALLGGIAGLTGGAAGEFAFGYVGGSLAGEVAAGAVSGGVGDAASQALELALGWRCDFDLLEVGEAAVLGGALAGAAGEVRAWWYRRGRLARDIAVNPEPPDAKPLANRTVGKNAIQNGQDAQLRADIAAEPNRGDPRVTQHMVNARGTRVGCNVPDYQYTRVRLRVFNRRVYIEYDARTSGRGPGHLVRLRANDPRGLIILKIVDRGINQATPYSGSNILAASPLGGQLQGRRQ